MQLRIKSLLSLVAVAAALPSASLAANSLSYTHVDVAVVKTELDDPGIDGDGPMIRGSLGITRDYFLFAEVADIGYDRDVDTLALQLGFGGHLAITPEVDLVGKVGFVHYDIDYGRYDDDDTGLVLAASARGFVVDSLEVEGGIRHINMSDYGSSTVLVGEGRYFFTPRIAGGVIVHVGDDSLIGVHARFTF